MRAFVGLIDVFLFSRFTITTAIAFLAACGGTPREASRPIVTAPPVAEPVTNDTNEPDLNKLPTTLLSIEWSTVQLASEADALALWQRIAPTGADWDAKVEEIPSDQTIASKLALALLRGGNFTCVPAQPARDCVKAPIDVPDPAPGATFVDPCLRRQLALWAIEELDEDDTPLARDALRAIAALPPPESQLVASAIKAIPETDHADVLEMIAIANRAGQRELVNGMLGTLDEAHLIEAVRTHRIDGALELLSADAHRAVYLAAITDERLHRSARTQAMTELVATTDKLAKDTRTALVASTKSKDCGVAAHAARILVQNGEKKLGPVRPRARKSEPMMRALCVLASYEQLQRADEASYLLGYVPSKGLELVKVTYDAYNDVDSDGDGDPHTERSATLVARDELVLPELEDMIRALRNCTGTTCKSDDREFRFGFRPGVGGELMLTRLEVVERPPCKDKQAIPNP